MSVLVLYGTRPEAIKLAPVVIELRALGIEPEVVCTGQHTDLLEGTPAESDMRGVSLGLASDGDVITWLTSAIGELEDVFDDLEPSVVVVQGDTMTAYAGAVVADWCGIEVHHVEAGVRSHASDPWPEERNRVEIAKVATKHYAPTATAVANLQLEGVKREDIVLTGNSIVSALGHYVDVEDVEKSNEVLVTLHRHEVQNPEKAYDLAKAIVHEAATHDVEVVWPMHPGFRRFVQIAESPHLKVVEPMDYVEFVRRLAGARACITDSGGVIEEAATLGVATAILRDHNDRPEAVAAGTAKLFPLEVGCVHRAFEWALKATVSPSAVFGTTNSTAEIATHLTGSINA